MLGIYISYLTDVKLYNRFFVHFFIDKLFTYRRVKVESRLFSRLKHTKLHELQFGRNADEPTQTNKLLFTHALWNHHSDTDKSMHKHFTLSACLNATVLASHWYMHSVSMILTLWTVNVGLLWFRFRNLLASRYRHFVSNSSIWQMNKINLFNENHSYLMTV